jgi:hypothetical protein
VVFIKKRIVGCKENILPLFPNSIILVDVKKLRKGLEK